jgi:hypothetical protein
MQRTRNIEFRRRSSQRDLPYVAFSIEAMLSRSTAVESPPNRTLPEVRKKSMKIPNSVRMGCGVTLALALLWCWYWVAADYSYKAVSGTYTFHDDGESSTLVLRPDRSFQQDLSRDGKIEHTGGTWRRIGEGGVVFSKEFLKVKGQEVRGDGQADGEIEKRFAGFFPSIRFEPQGPEFNRRLFQ